MEWRVPLADLDFGKEEEEAVIEVLRSKWLTMGAVTQEFENQFARFTGAKYAFAVSNATEALHLACTASGIGPGDEVIVPSLSFVATSNAVLYTGADVRFAEICSEDNLTIDLNDIERNLTARTKAIIVMHYGGYPCNMAEIMDLAKNHQLTVIEDAAHCPGASLDGKALGTWGNIGCFSFFSNKNLSTGEGGMVVTDDSQVADKIRIQRSHGMTTLTYERHKGHAYSYDVVDLGYNYRIDEIRSALGIAQLKKLSQNNQRRNNWTSLYRVELERVKGVKAPFGTNPGISAHHLMPVVLEPGVDRKKVIDQMREDRIQTSIHYPPTHRFSYYRSRYGNQELPKTENVADRELTLPLYPTMTEEDVKLVVDSLKRAIS